MLRVLTYNIRGGLGMDGRRDTERIAQVVAAQGPDVICFQEVHQRLPWSGFVDQPGRLRQALGMSFEFQANLRVGFGGYGLGIATPHRIQAVRRHLLTSMGEQRGALEVQIQSPIGPVTVFCTHWGLSRDERVKQAAEMTEWVQAAPVPVVVCGDLNDRPGVDYIQDMRSQTGLMDAGEAEDVPTFPSDVPQARIDVIFHSPGLRSPRVTVGGSQASDHLPIWADFEEVR